MPSGFETALEEAIAALANERFGAESRRTSLVAEAIRRLSDRYNRIAPRPAARGGKRRRDSRRHDLLAQLCFFTPADLPKVGFVLTELQSARGLPMPTTEDGGGHLRLLDVGAGCGAQTLGVLAHLLERGGPWQVEVDAMDVDGEALALFAQLARRLEPWLERREVKLALRTERLDLRQRPRGGRYDLIVAGTVLAEIAEEAHQRLVEGLLAELAAGGALLLIEPALRATARALHALRDRLLAGGHCSLAAPCTHRGPCPALERADDWCHELRIWQPPPRLRELASACGLRRRDLKWSYATLLPAQAAAAAEDGRYRVVSSLLRSKGKREVFICGAGGRQRLVRLDRHASDANADFGRLARGTLVRLEQAEEGKGDALRVLEQTRVEAIDATER